MDNLSLFLKVGKAMYRTLDLDKRIYIILTCATAGCVFGFSRAFLLLKNEKTGMLEGKMGVGPASQEDANKIWCQMSQENKSLEELMAKYDKISTKESMPLFPVVKKLNISLSKENEPVIRCLKQKEPIKVTKDSEDGRASGELLNILGIEEFVCVPLIVEDKAIGILLADNLYSHRPIQEGSVQSLALFFHQIGVAIEEARLHHKLIEDQRKLREMEKELRRSYVLTSLGEVSSYLAHEIRNPLVIIGGFARSILKSVDKSHASEEIKEKVETIIREAERLENLLSKTLDFVHANEPVLQLRDLIEIIEEVCDLTEKELTKRGIQLLKTLRPIPYLRISKDQIKQILFNLIQNAIESMPEGGELQIKTDQEKKFVKIEIAETGGGILHQIRKKILLQFYTTKAKGSGLGLSIVRRIVEQHNGYLNVESVENKGTLISIELPIPEK